MGYHGALEAAGAKVLEFERFGDWQGSWWAKIEINGKQCWVHGSYGSCSGCDAYEATFDYTEGECSEHRYEGEEAQAGCKACQAAKADYQKRLAEFGGGYIFGNEFTQEEAEKETKPDDSGYSWKSDTGVYEFITSHPIV